MTNWLARAKREIAQNGENALAGAYTKNEGNLTITCTQKNIELASHQAANDKPSNELAGNMRQSEHALLVQWLAHIGETDQAEVAHFLVLCQHNLSDKQWFLAKAKRDMPITAVPDERRTCQQCANLTPRGICLAAHRGEISASRSFSPVTTIPMRCKGFAPGSADRDKRAGMARWYSKTR